MHPISYILFITTNIVLVASTNFLESSLLATEYNAQCSDDSQCKWLGLNSKCTYGTCRCETGYHWYLGECRKYETLGGDCVQDLDCYDGYNPLALVCIEKKCTCATGYYSRGNIDCRKMAIEEESICALNIDCKVSETTCQLGKCKVASTTFLETVMTEKAAEEELEYEIIPLSVKETNTCNNIENAEYYNETSSCICKKQYFFNSNKTACLPEIGVNIGCKQDSDCPLKPGQCVDGACFCRDYYFVDEAKQNCVKTISETNLNCLSLQWCYAFGPHSYCYSNGTCACRLSADFDNATETCIPNGKEGYCVEDGECNTNYGEVCIDQKCGCPENYVIIDSVCIPTTFGDKCDRVQNCDLLENSVCLDGLCQCKEPYNIVLNNTCFIGSHLEGDCTYDEQCMVLYSECNDNHKCVCQDGRNPFENNCYQIKEFSSYCDSLIECTLSLGDTVQCRNRMCQCPTGYAMEEDKCSSAVAIKSSILLMALILKKVLLAFR